jgi:hypothetical protein
MSFLDNLENNLKSLESGAEGKEEVERQRRGRQAERENALAAAPWAEELKKGRYTADLLSMVSRMGHERRVKVHIAWLGAALRLEARDRRLEFRPTPEGVIAVAIADGREGEAVPVDLNGSPEPLLRQWLEAA